MNVNATPVDISSINVTGSTVVLIMDYYLVFADTVTIDYTLGSNPIQDLVGIDASALFAQAVTNNTQNCGLITVGSIPYHFSIAGTNLYVVNRGSNSVSVIDTTSNTVTATISVGTGPEYVTLVGTDLYVSNRGSNNISVIDTVNNTVTTTISVGTQPIWSLLVGDDLYVSNISSANVSVIDTTTNTVTATISVGTTPVYSTLVGTNLYVSNQGSANVSVIDTTSNTVTATISVGTTPVLAILVGTDLYVSNKGSNNVSVVNITSNTVTATISVGTTPVYSTLVGTDLYILNLGSDNVSVIDTTTNTVSTTISVGDVPSYSTLVGTDLYVTNQNSNNVSIIDTISNTVTATISVGTVPTYAALVGSDLYVMNWSTANISIINTSSQSTYVCPVYECSDNVDNDSDGFTDMDDPNCENITDDYEQGGGSRPTPTSGSCGTSHNTFLPIAPTGNLCSNGSDSPVISTPTRWTWSCNGTNGGSSISCFATKILQPPPPPLIPFRFNITPATTTVNVFGGQSTTTKINIGLVSGTSTKVFLTAQTIEPTITQIFSPTFCAPPCSSTLTIKTIAATPKSDIGIPYQIFVFASSTNILKSSYFTLKVKNLLSDFVVLADPPEGDNLTNDIIIIPPGDATSTPTSTVLLDPSSPTSTEVTPTPTNPTDDFFITNTTPNGDITPDNKKILFGIKIPAKLESVLKNIAGIIPLIQKITNAIALVGVAVMPILTFIASLLINPVALKDLFLLPLRLWGSILTALGIRKRTRLWGTVYDSVTKQPLDPALVTLKTVSGEYVTEAITDLDGRYGFLVEPGIYTIFAEKTDYKYPSEKLKEKFNDELYQDLYFNEPISIVESGQVIAKNIPMDPLKFNWNEFIKNKQKLTKFYSKRDLLIAKISSVLFWGGSLSAIYGAIINPKLLNFTILLIYAIIYILRKTNVIRARARGVVRFKNNNVPIPFAIIKVFSASSNVLIIKKVTNKIGRYFLLIPNGRYYLSVDKKNEDESYTEIYKSDAFDVKNGKIDKKLEV